MKAVLLDPSLPACDLGEGPYWQHSTQTLYWVDITGQKLHRYHLPSCKHETCTTPSTIGFAVTDDRGRIVAGLQDGIYGFDFSKGNFEALVKPAYADADNRFNDGKCDRAGRLWAGTMNDKDHGKSTGAFYRFDQRGLHVQETDIFISNGTGWSPDNKIMYYTDTVRRVIWQYDFDFDTGTASNRRVFKEFKDKGRPDGSCVDSQGRVLTALWPGWGVEIHAPDGKLVDRIELPVPQVSSCCFGGPDFKTLFITTARVGMTADALNESPLSGQVFTVEMDVAGLPETPFRHIP